MTHDRSPYAVLDELAGHARGDDLARLVHTVAFAAADERRATLSDGLGELADRAGLTAEDAETSFGNVLRTLERKDVATSADARTLLATLLARGVALCSPEGADAEGRVAEVLIWLATHTAVDALPALDAALGDRAAGLWTAIGGVVRRVDAGELAEIDRAGAVIAAAALRGSASPAARAEAAALSGDARDPVVRALLKDATSRDAGPSSDRDAGASPASVRGEIVPAPRNPIVLILLAITGILLVLHLVRLLGRLILRYRHPAEVTITNRGLTVRARTQLFGRTLREGETHIPTEALRSVRREVRYPRLSLYAGLVSLGIGTYLGVSLVVDGTRAGSPELLGVGALFLAFGAALDFAFAHLAARSSGRCRVIIVPRSGRVVALGGADPALADAALAELLRR